MAPEDRTERLTWPAVGLSVVTFALAVALAFLTDPPLVAPIVLFGALYFFAENIDLELPSGANLSGGFMIVMATIFVFRTEHAPLGALLVGLCGGLYLPQLRRRDWRKVLYNTGSFGIAMTIGYGVLALFPNSWLDSTALLLLATVPTALVYFAANVVMVSFAVARLRGEPMRGILRQLAGWQFQIYPFAFLGVVIGALYVDVGAAVVPLVVAPILVARQAYAAYLRREGGERGGHGHARAGARDEGPVHGRARRARRDLRGVHRRGARNAPRALERLRLAALTHDIGKLVVPNHLLNKPGRLTWNEFEIVRRHEEVSKTLLERIDFLASVVPIALGVYQPLGARHEALGGRAVDHRCGGCL